ncbi:MAG: hypothetical protein ACPG1A_15455 [Halioglobus sp.]
MHYYQSHMAGIRKAIEEGELEEFAQGFYDGQASGR